MLQGRQRLDKAVIKKGTKRPSVFLAEEALKILGYYDGDLDGWAGGGVDQAIRDAQAELITPDIEGDDVDGKMGGDTWSAILPKAYAKGFKPELWRRIQSMICYYEVGERQNAYGAAGAIDDGAGCNYGISQHNTLGSVRRILKMNGERNLLGLYDEWNTAGKRNQVLPELRNWFNSGEGIKAQDEYFREVVWKRAHRYLPGLKVFNAYKGDPKLNQFYERALALLCDCVIQNGGLWSPHAKPFWRTITEDEKKVPRYVELVEGARWDEKLVFHCSYEELKVRWTEIEKNNKKKWPGDDKKSRRKVRDQTNEECMCELVGRISQPEIQLFIVGQMRARSSSSRWWVDVENRRMVSALGQGRVHGTKHDIQRDWGIGIEPDPFPDAPEETLETFLKHEDNFAELKADADGK